MRSIVKNLNIESSYKENNLGLILYDLVLKLKPKLIIEFGTLHGYSAVSMGIALKRLNNGHIKTYDIWNDYNYNKSTITSTQETIQKYKLRKYITLGKRNLNNWLLYPEEFDLLHIDISNDGTIIKNVHNKLKNRKKGTIIFEGGSKERDNIEWMKMYNKKPIQSIMKEVKYKILTDQFPSMSIMKG